ncbi:MAG: alanine racemase [Betaproteobacteria bacterium]|nr:alanine racemase [Betaproteobacteria bacterium]
MSRPARVRILPAALRHNLARARELAPGCPVWAVVKADAYGHGIAAALAGFAQADGLALVEFDRALSLRQAGWQRPLLMLEGAFSPDDVGHAAQARLSLVVHQPDQLRWLASLPSGAGLEVFVKLNTGMNRLGFPPAALPEALAALRSLPGIGRVHAMTHFANADRPGGADAPLARFQAALPDPAIGVSLANSAAIFDVPAARRGWLRPGIMLYGASPFADRPAITLGLRPAMRFESRLIAVQSLSPGDAVGYGGGFVASAAMRIGVVATGYADGYPRHAPTGTPVAVSGVRTRVVGRVSMDMLTVDLSSLPQARPGDPVELWGEQVPVDEVAAHAGTIGYELLCAIAPRVTRLIED